MLLGCAADSHGWIEVAADGKGFVRDGQPFLPWGYNYDRTVMNGRDVLLEEVLREEPGKLDRDFGRMREMGGNTVRLFCQMGDYFDGPGRIRPAAFQQLETALDAAERNRLHVLLVGVNHIRPSAIPQWLKDVDDATLQDHHALFWEAAARYFRGRSVIMAYDLINEPIIPSDDSDLLVDGCFAMRDGEKFCYVHRLLRRFSVRWTQWVHGRFGSPEQLRSAWPDYPRPGETWEQIAVPRASAEDPRFPTLLECHRDLLVEWSLRMRSVIRSHDTRHLITVGALNPPAFAPAVDFFCAHLYPAPQATLEANEAEWRAAMDAIPAGKPVVIEEFYPLAFPPLPKGVDVHQALIASLRRATAPKAVGFVSFYWGPSAEIQSNPMAAAMYDHWLQAWSTARPQ